MLDVHPRLTPLRDHDRLLPRAQQLPRDDEILYLRRPLVDPQRAHRAVEPLDRILRQHPPAAEDLDRGVDDPLGGLGGEDLAMAVRTATLLKLCLYRLLSCASIVQLSPASRSRCCSQSL